MRKQPQAEPYEIYIQVFGKLIGGMKMSNNDFGVSTAKGLNPFDKKGKLAVAMAAQDVKNETSIKSEAEFTKEFDRLLG